jgi:hypothetical protein
MASASASRAVSAQLVHKQSAEQMLLEDWRQAGERGYLITARWSRARGRFREFYFEPDGRPDPMLVIESVRQCLPLLSHAAFGVPLDHHLVWESFGCRLVPDALDADEPLDRVEIDVHCDDVRRRGARVTMLAFRFVLRRGGAELATAWTRFAVHPPGVYLRVRGDSASRSSAELHLTPPEPVNPREVGRRAEAYVLLSATQRPDAWLLRLDTGHPIFFDHPVDHVPGALLLDAALQTARAAAHDPDGPSRAVEIDSRFSRFVELDVPCELEAKPMPSADAEHEQVEVTCTSQSAGPAFCSVVTLQRAPAA